MADESDNSVLLNVFHSANGCKKYRIIFHKRIIVWDNDKPPSEQKTLNIENVIAVQNTYVRTHPLEERRINPHQFTIHYAEQNNVKWKYNSLTLGHNDSMQVSSWVKTLQNHLQRLTERPKRLLLFVNPFGGKQDAMQIYEKYAKPLFNIAGIEVTVNVSQRKNQIKDYVLNHNLDMFDSIVVVGGDGTASELFNGLVLRECNNFGVDYDDIEKELPKPKLPIGIIPGGSTDTIVYCLHGTSDRTTAVMHIIFGNKLGLDLVSVYDECNLLRLYASILSYGFLGDVAYHSDQYRWMGPNRYNYSGFRNILSNKGYSGEIAFYTDVVQNQQCRCYENCHQCISMRNKNDDGIDKREWKTLKGNFFMISGANISCACKQSPNGIAPYGHLGDGNLYLVIVRHTSIINNLKFLMRLSSGDCTFTDLPFVETYCAKEFCFRATDHCSRWNCDGEVQHQSNIRAKVRCQLLTIFSRGSPKPPQVLKTCCGF